eukprot:XP_011667913.1 PREDICTED: uncharacterized protein LOC105439998 [Strongylocentrotus purpuratus]
MTISFIFLFTDKRSKGLKRKADSTIPTTVIEPPEPIVAPSADYHLAQAKPAKIPGRRESRNIKPPNRELLESDQHQILQRKCESAATRALTETAVGATLGDSSFCQASTSQVPEGACIHVHGEEDENTAAIPLKRSNDIQPARKTASKHQLQLAPPVNPHLQAPPRSQSPSQYSTVKAPLQADQRNDTAANEILYLARLQVEILQNIDMKFDKILEKFDKILEKFV